MHVSAVNESELVYGFTQDAQAVTLRSTNSCSCRLPRPTEWCKRTTMPWTGSESQSGHIYLVRTLCPLGLSELWKYSRDTAYFWFRQHLWCDDCARVDRPDRRYRASLLRCHVRAQRVNWTTFIWCALFALSVYQSFENTQVILHMFDLANIYDMTIVLVQAAQVDSIMQANYDATFELAESIGRRLTGACC